MPAGRLAELEAFRRLGYFRRGMLRVIQRHHGSRLGDSLCEVAHRRGRVKGST